MSAFGDLCGLTSCDYSETYGEAELSLALMGTGTTRSLYILVAREILSKRFMFDLRVEAGMEALMARARRANRSADGELRSVAVSYARYVVDIGAYHHTPHFRLEIGENDEVLEPIGPSKRRSSGGDVVGQPGGRD